MLLLLALTDQFFVRGRGPASGSLVPWSCLRKGALGGDWLALLLTPAHLRLRWRPPRVLVASVPLQVLSEALNFRIRAAGERLSVQCLSLCLIICFD